MLSPKTKRNISRIIPFGVIWFIFGMVFFIVEKAALSGLDTQSSTAIQVDTDIFIFGTLANLAVGLLVGAIEVFYLNQAFADKSFSKKILYKSLFYISLLLLITLITYPIAASMELQTSILDRRVWQKLSIFLTSMTHLSTDVQLAVTLGASLFYSEISENIGHGILKNFFTGKYHQPIVEERIFMFLDMKSSTTIAEKLGHVRYFELLRDYFADLSEPTLNYLGEIYQYVGDEVIVSWTVSNGIENNNCLKCFFAMKAALQAQEAKYQETFGVMPTFKAGLHIGEVTTGEIGVLKKDIIFTGDVLNTTARIQGLCNSYGVELLVSEQLIDRLQLDGQYHLKSLGESDLRGRNESIAIMGVSN